MNELIQKTDDRTSIRWRLLAGASALALTAYVSSNIVARAEDGDRPQVWIEVGGQLSRLQDSQQTFESPLMDVRPSMFSPSQNFEKSPLYSVDEEGKLSFQPEESGWVFSAAIQYGRSTKADHIHQQTYPAPFQKYFVNGNPVPSTYTFGKKFPSAAKFADTKVKNSEQHTILDFTAGKDVGLGMFGKVDSSVLSFGVRFAQFSSKSNVAIKSDPDWHFSTKYVGSVYKTFVLGQPFHSNAATFNAQRSFHGIGPTIAWSASAPFAGNPQDGELSFDWGINGAVLFGRQRTETHHQSTARYHPALKYGVTAIATISRPPPVDHLRSRSVIVPNIGGSAGLSWRLQNFKVSFGYKADFFFGAMDGGIDVRRTEDIGFFGPFASVSIGLGG